MRIGSHLLNLYVYLSNNSNYYYCVFLLHNFFAYVNK